MQLQQREALSALRLTWAPTADDLWHSQGALHVGGLHDRPMGDVMAAFGDAQRDIDSSPLGVVVRGPAGSGKTHLLGQVREQVQTEGGYFFLVELLDATGFWQSTRAGILESLGRPGAERDTQLKDLLWELSSVAHISRANRRAVIGDDELTPEILTDFVNSLHKARRETVRRAHHTLRAMVLLAAMDLELPDIGEAFLTANDDFGRGERDVWGLPAPTLTPQESVRDISRLIALAGPSVLALDQIDTLLAQSPQRTDTGPDASRSGAGNQDLEHVAHGLMSMRQTMRRTVPVVACLPAAWEAIQERATATVQDRFRATALLQGLPTPDVGRAILERRFTGSYGAIGFTAPYPSWPILPSAFDEATQYTPRQLLKRADAHVRRCLERDTIEELTRLTGETAEQHAPADEDTTRGDTAGLDQRFVEYRRRAVTAAALDPDGEDTTMPGLLSAALEAWITERGEAEQSFRPDPPPGQRVVLHARLRQSLNAATDDERHWAFRAIASGNAVAVQNRVRKAWEATGFNPDRRRLFLLRNSRWPSGAKTAAMLAEFEAAGGRVLPLGEEDVRTMTALRDLIDDNHPDLPEWLRQRRPGHGIALLRSALGDLAGDPPPPVVTPEQVPPPPVPDQQPAIVFEHSPTALTLGLDSITGQPVSVELAALRKHTAIFAGSGSGKTVLIRRLVEECALRGVSSIVLDPNNDLSRLGSRWPEPPPGWQAGDNDRADEYFTDTEVVVWTPRRSTGRPLSFQPLPDFASVLDDEDEFSDAVESAVAALEPRALISGNTAKANHSRAVLREALRFYGARAGVTLHGFINLLSDLPAEVSALSGAHRLAAELGQNLRAAVVNDPLFGGAGAAADPAALLTPSPGCRARVSVISMVGLTNDQQREGFVNQLQMALFAWIKRNPAGDRPLGGLLVMDEAQNFAPSTHTTACTHSTLALSSQARKYGLGLVFATQAPRGLHNHIPGNATTQFYGLLNSPTQIAVAREMARVKGGLVPDISKLRSGQFYLALEGNAFHKIQTPWCLSHHPPSPPTTDEVLALAQRELAAR